MKRLIVPLTLLIFIVSATLRAGDDERAITACIKKETSSFAAKDYDAWATCWAHEPYIMELYTTAGRLTFFKSWDSLSMFAKAVFASETTEPGKIETSNYDIHISGDMAVVYADENVSYGSGDGKIFNLDKGLYNLKKENGEWRIISVAMANTTSYENRDLSAELKINIAGYQLLSENQIDKAIKVFTLNTELYPKSFNTWDSLAEAYMSKGDKETAIKYYKKSLELNPQNTNAQKMIDKMQSE